MILKEKDKIELSSYLFDMKEAFSSLYKASENKNYTNKIKVLQIEVKLWIKRLNSILTLLSLEVPPSMITFGPLEAQKELFDPVLEFWKKQI